MSMTRPQPCNVLLVASVSAALHAGTAVLFVPLLSFLMLWWGTAPAQLTGLVDRAMVFAVMAPIFSAIFGFLAGGLFAWAYNVFAGPQRHVVFEVQVKEPERAVAASMSNVA